MQDSSKSEIHKRLAHLKNLPSNPMREREIRALERTLQMAPEVAATRRASASRPSRKRESTPRIAPTEPQKPLRRVEFEGTRRKIIIRKASPQKPRDDQESEADRRALEDAKRNIRSLREGSHFGMS